MAKKAKLDILEIASEELSGETRQDEAAAETGGGDEATGEQTGGDLRPKVLGWVRRPLFWIVLLSVVFLGLTAGILGSFYQSMEGDAPVVQKKQALSGSPLPKAREGVLFEGMVVNQNDVKGNIRIVFCDVVLEWVNDKTADAVDGGRVDVRTAIYAVLKKEPAQEGLSAEGRGRLKEKLRNELNGLFGANLVKEVYFTRYELD